MKQMAELHVLFVIFVTWIVRTPCVGMINIMGDRGRERQDSYIIHSTMEIAMQAPFSCCRCQFFAAAGLVLLTCCHLKTHQIIRERACKVKVIRTSI